MRDVEDLATSCQDVVSAGVMVQSEQPGNPVSTAENDRAEPSHDRTWQLKVDVEWPAFKGEVDRVIVK